MSPDYARTPFNRLYRTDDHSFRMLPVMTQAVAAFLRAVVDPTHGWMQLRRANYVTAIRDLTTGPLGRADVRVLTAAVTALVRAGYLTRCQVLEDDDSLGTFMANDATLPVSPWLENPDGTALVITDWVPSEHGLTEQQTSAWHELRRLRVQSAL